MQKREPVNSSKSKACWLALKWRSLSSSTTMQRAELFLSIKCGVLQTALRGRSPFFHNIIQRNELFSWIKGIAHHKTLRRRSPFCDETMLRKKVVYSIRRGTRGLMLWVQSLFWISTVVKVAPVCPTKRKTFWSSKEVWSPSLDTNRHNAELIYFA